MSSSMNESGRAAPLVGLFQPPSHGRGAGSTIGLPDDSTDENAGSLNHLQNLFRQPSYQGDNGSGSPETSFHRKSTRKGSNTTACARERSEFTSLLDKEGLNGSSSNHSARQQHFREPSYGSSTTTAPTSLFHSPVTAHKKTPKTGSAGRKQLWTSSMIIPPVQPHTAAEAPIRPTTTTTTSCFQEAFKELVMPTTWIGAFMFVLYHVVFCLASGSAIIRPNAKNSILGLMTKMAALGVMFSAPVYLYNIGNDMPCLYPTCDLFLAPILASIAIIIDNNLAQMNNLSDEENDEIFLATFAFLTFVGMALSGCLLILASVFRLANLGAFLPFPVLCGFFAAVGILTWHLGFVVDTSGKTFSMVFFSGDSAIIIDALTHHIPGIIVAIIMKYLGPKNPFYVVVVLFATIAAVYAVLFVTGTSLEEARGMGWFWYYEDIVYDQMSATIGFSKWLPPAPFGMLNGVMTGKVHWPSVWEGLQPACALSFLYLIRCALHSAALLKNIPNLARTVVTQHSEPDAEASMAKTYPRKKTRMEVFSEMVDIEEVMNTMVKRTSTQNNSTTAPTEIERVKPTTWSLQGVLMQYGLAQVVSAVVGGFGVIPSVATSHAMYSLRAEKVAPQLGSVLLLSLFYLTDFRLIAFVPKMAFSCLLSLASIDIALTWFIRSYFKTKEKIEWLVVPLIVILAFGLGLLKAVFMGIAISTFLFVAAFFRSGVVKFAASGLSLRSTIERPAANAQWLDENGDLIQVVILQNYLFFGNASSILAYISSMFEENSTGDDNDNNDDEDLAVQLQPLPKFVVLDMALVTGMDTSTVSVISDIVNVCDRHDCKLFLSGMSASLRSVLAHAGVKPLGGERSKRKLRFFTALDTAIGKAEDMLLDFQKESSMRHLPVLGEESGFQVALRFVDEQHGTSFAKDLVGLEEYTTPIELEVNESLDDSPSRPERGLFFIEAGVLKIERDSSLTANTRSLASLTTPGGSSSMRPKESGVEAAMAYASQQQSFRLARMGVGWVLGTVEAVTGLQKAGTFLAVTSCRLHYLSYSCMEKLEETNPILTLRLYKLLSYLMAKQHELTVGQLGTLHTIMASPAQNKPIGRKTKRA